MVPMKGLPQVTSYREGLEKAARPGLPRSPGTDVHPEKESLSQGGARTYQRWHPSVA